MQLTPRVSPLNPTIQIMQLREQGTCEPGASESVVTQTYGIIEVDIGHSDDGAGGCTNRGDETVRGLRRSRNVEV
jgi:hypothetical protein